MRAYTSTVNLTNLHEFYVPWMMNPVLVDWIINIGLETYDDGTVGESVCFKEMWNIYVTQNDVANNPQYSKSPAYPT